MTAAAMTAPPEKLLVEFIVEFINNEAFRFNVLRRERTTMEQFGLNSAQINTLLTLKSADILPVIKDELVAWGADIDALDPLSQASRAAAAKVLKAVEEGTAGLSAIRALVASASMYAEGQIHIREVSPGMASVNQPTSVELKGHGFDIGQNNNVTVTPQIRFSKLNEQGSIDTSVTPVIVSALDVTVDNDLYQHATLQVTLTSAGTWAIDARNMSLESWHPQQDPDSRIVVA